MIFGCITAVSAIVAAAVCWIYGNFASLGILLLALGSFAGCFVILSLGAVVVLWLFSAVIDTSKPQEEDDKLYRKVMLLYAEAIIRYALVDLKVAGLEKAPEGGRVLLVCNHQSESDPVFLEHVFPKYELSFIAKKEVKDMIIVGKYMHKIHFQPLDRENDREALKTILRCVQLIKNDIVSIGVFPEGGMLGDYKLYPFRPGVFKIAQKAGVPIMVCTLRGTTDLFRNLKRLKRTQVELHLVDVIPAEELKGKTAVEISDRVHQLMAEDLGPAWQLP